MRVASLGVARPVYYDRNPVRTTGGYYAAVAPHSVTTRWTITATAAQKIFIDSISISMMRATAATTSAMAFTTVDQPLNTSVSLAFFNNATVGATVEKSPGGSILVLPGDAIAAQTTDTSTGGTIHYAVYCHGVVFDA